MLSIRLYSRRCPGLVAMRGNTRWADRTHCLMKRYYVTSQTGLTRVSWGSRITVLAIATAIGIAELAIANRRRVEKSAQPPVEKLAQPPAADRSAPREVKQISFDELEKHKSRDSCWIMVRNQIYDVTDFLVQHPGGVNVIIANSGKDATGIYESLHPSGLFETLLTPEQFIGVIDPSTLKTKEAVRTEDDIRVEKARANMPPIELMINSDDFEELARKVLSKVAWSYYSSSADGQHAYKGNLDAFSRYWFRPRVLRKVRNIDMATKILGMDSSLPIFICPNGLAKLGHPSGEIGMTRGAYRTGIIQAITNYPSCTFEEISGAKQGDQNILFQLYVNGNHSISEQTVRRVEALGFKAILVTVDTPCVGKREADMKARGPALISTSTEGKTPKPVQSGIANSISTMLDANLNWEDLAWLKSVTKLPIIIKGIQCVEDVELAAQHGCAGVLLSNHGGRQLDYAPASIDILYELRQRRPDILDNKTMEVYCDGGFRRGTDVLKALCLGATAVGLGRPFLYANSAFGEEGVVRLVEILEEEIATGMRLLGAARLDELKPEMIRRIDKWKP